MGLRWSEKRELKGLMEPIHEAAKQVAAALAAKRDRPEWVPLVDKRVGTPTRKGSFWRLDRQFVLHESGEIYDGEPIRRRGQGPKKPWDGTNYGLTIDTYHIKTLAWRLQAEGARLGVDCTRIPNFPRDTIAPPSGVGTIQRVEVQIMGSDGFPADWPRPFGS